MKEIPEKLRTKYLGIEEKECLFRMLREKYGFSAAAQRLHTELIKECLSLIEDNLPEKMRENYSSRVISKCQSFYLNPKIFGINGGLYPSNDIPRRFGEEEIPNAAPIKFSSILLCHIVPKFDFQESMEWKPENLDTPRKNRIRDLILDYLENLYKDANLLIEYRYGRYGNFLDKVKTWGKLKEINEEWFNMLIEKRRGTLSDKYLVEDPEDPEERKKSEMEELIDSLANLRMSLGF